MELKNYQKKVMENLSSYLLKINRENNLLNAWASYWEEQDIMVGDKVPYYHNEIKGVPQVCMKVPTGGGKTFMACASLRRIFDKLPSIKEKVVVWLVPSEPILVQTIKNLSNVNHPYRQRLDADFNGRVGIYTKDMLLNGENFSPDTIKEMLTICVISYDSFRRKSKDGVRVYRENGNLKRFADLYNSDSDINLEDIPETALIQTLRHLSPVVIVDESHNAVSDLSLEMLKNLNPSFILELTATPKEKSNIISYVDARELKKENMVKLPVIVYNRNSVSDVIRDAISMRNALEKQAIQQENISGEYVRPIVLFQAQPKKSDDSETFEKIKSKLLEIGIPEEEIAIKTANINELKSDLLSKECKIKYIITVNALKEGWDCPFAYILASLANKTSVVDVEQILGRILRQPHAQKFNSTLLNTSYVFTSSNDFHDTLTNIISGLNRAGFSKKEYRVADEDELIPPNEDINNSSKQLSISTEEETTDIQNDIENIDTNLLKDVIDNIDNNVSANEELNKMVEQAVTQSEQYDSQVKETDNSLFDNGGNAGMKNQYTVQEQYVQDIKELKLPQFFVKCPADLFGKGYSLLEPENLSEGFILNEQDARLNFNLATGDIYKVDVEDGNVPKYRKISETEGEYLRKTLASKPKEEQLKSCAEWLTHIINRNNRYSTQDVQKYVSRIIENFSNDELSAIAVSIYAYAEDIKKKIDKLERSYREKLFDKWIDSGRIVCREEYKLSNVITPIEVTDSIPKSLYKAEKNDMNGLEHKIIDSIVGLDNVLSWWHRIIERNDFRINGFINHFPDFIIKTKSGKIILIEVKGDDRDNSDSKSKLKLGRKWQSLAPSDKYRYFMVFDKQEFNEEGAYKLDDFIEMLKEM